MLLAFFSSLTTWYIPAVLLTTVDWLDPTWQRILPAILYFLLFSLLIARGTRIGRQALIAMAGIDFSSACALSIALIAFTRSTDALSALIAIGMFGVYTISRAGIINLRSWVVPASLVVFGLMIPFTTARDNWQRSGGLFNADLAAGVIILLAVMWKSKYQWVAVGFACGVLFFAGVEEAIVGIFFLLVTGALHKEWLKRVIAPLSVISVMLAIFTPMGIAETIWQKFPPRIVALQNIVVARDLGPLPDDIPAVNDGSLPGSEPASPSMDTTLALGYRWPIWARAVQGATWFGYGFRGIAVVPHNAPLAILESAGLLAMLLWLFLVIRALVVSRLAYPVVAVCALSLFDHYIWYQLWPLTWIILGNSERLYQMERLKRGVLTTANIRDNVPIWVTGVWPYFRFWQL